VSQGEFKMKPICEECGKSVRMTIKDYDDIMKCPSCILGITKQKEILK
jgi:DNA-directed RNA polymerase subunit RPC12/RpoP